MISAKMDTAKAIAKRHDLNVKIYRQKLRERIAWYRKPQDWTRPSHSDDWDDMIAIAEAMSIARTKAQATPEVSQALGHRSETGAPQRPIVELARQKSAVNDQSGKLEFSRSALEMAGFVGWIPLSAVRSSSCPRSGGVYVVTYGGEHPARFAERSCGGWFKDRDPSVSPEVLVENWVEGAEVVYIGKADQLRRRLTQFADFGAGKPVGHWGGRLIWQLHDIAALRVAWRETPNQVPVQAEAILLALFRQACGKPPFANDPHRLGH